MVGAREEAMEDMAVVDTTVVEEDHTVEVVGHMEAEGMVVVVKPMEEGAMGAAVRITMEEEDMEVEVDMEMEETMAEIMGVTMETMVEIVVKNRNWADGDYQKSTMNLHTIFNENSKKNLC